MVPTHYTMVEGGEYKRWDFGSVDSFQLARRNPAYVYINGHITHSLLIIGSNKKILHRWDCVNGMNEPKKEESDEQK